MPLSHFNEDIPEVWEQIGDFKIFHKADTDFRPHFTYNWKLAFRGTEASHSRLGIAETGGNVPLVATLKQSHRHIYTHTYLCPSWARRHSMLIDCLCRGSVPPPLPPPACFSQADRSLPFCAITSCRQTGFHPIRRPALPRQFATKRRLRCMHTNGLYVSPLRPLSAMIKNGPRVRQCLKFLDSPKANINLASQTTAGKKTLLGSGVPYAVP